MYCERRHLSLVLTCACASALALVLPLASGLLFAPAALAAEAAAETAADAKVSHRMPYEDDLDKINDVEPCVIKNVTISGNKVIPRSQIKAVIKVKSGDFYHRQDSEKDLKAVYNLGYFTRADLHVDSEKTASGMVLNIHLKEYPVVKSFSFSGNKVLATAQLQELVKNQVLKPENKKQERAVIKTIIADYKKQGYLLATAHTESGVVDEHGNDKNVGRITFIIDEGILDKIEIKCLNDEEKKIVEDALTIKVGDAYNENKVAADLRTAFKSGKFANLDRAVVLAEDKKGYLLTIESKPPEEKPSHSKPAARTSHKGLLTQGKSAAALPVLNKYIKSPMYKNLK